jgi:hypothetical protein
MAMRILGLAIVTVLLNGAAHAAADVTFKNVDSYIDATFERPKSERNLREVQEGLRKVFSKLADKYLPPGQPLAVEVIGIDLAGRLEPTFSSGDIRIMQGVTWPRLQFTYTVTENGAVVASGQADIRDSDYLNGFNNQPYGDRLRYERQLIADWFRKTFGKPT